MRYPPTTCTAGGRPRYYWPRAGGRADGCDSYLASRTRLPRRVLRTRTALVTGSTCAVGTVVATLLAEDGYRVIATDRNSEPARRVAAGLPGRGHRGLALDLDDPASIASVLGSLASLDVLICGTGDRVEPADASLAADSRIVRPDPYGPWRLAKAAVPLLLRGTRPRLVLVAGMHGGAALEPHGDSRGGVERRGRLAGGNGTGRAALQALTSTLAAQLADTPVLVNAVCPGLVATLDGQPDRSVSAAADSVLWAVRIADDGPRGGCFRDGEPVPW